MKTATENQKIKEQTHRKGDLKGIEVDQTLPNHLNKKKEVLDQTWEEEVQVVATALRSKRWDVAEAEVISWEKGREECHVAQALVDSLNEVL